MDSLRTDRLLLRPWQPDEWPALHALHADPYVAAWLGGALTETQAQTALAAICNEYTLGYGLYALCMPDGAIVGAAGLQRVRPGMPFQGIEASWRLRQSAQGQGYACEAMRRVLADADERLVLGAICSYTARTNLRSQALMHRLGFVPDPARDFDHPRLPAEHPLRPHVYYERRVP